MARDDKRKRTYFPSIDSRFMGALEPSPNTGSYYNPSRYAGQGFSRPELRRIEKNLANVYNQDLQYNRAANPGYQTTQDTGYSSSAQFGTGRASPATTQNYALQFGTPTGNGLSTFQTPSGGSITYRPSGRILGGGAQPTVSPGSADLREPLAQMAAIQSGAYEKGFGSPVYPKQPTPLTPSQGLSKAAGYVLMPGPNTLSEKVGQGIMSGAGSIGTFAYNASRSIGNLLNPQPTQPSTQSQNYYAYNPSPVPRQPNRYFDF